MGANPQAESSSKCACRRKLDKLYLGFFAFHIVVLLAVDLVPFYPDNLRPAALDKLRAYYVDKYQDKFFTDPPIWFWGYIALEALYHMPLSIWAVGALAKDHPLVPVHLLVWGVQTFCTTLTCLLEVWGWEDRTDEQKWKLTGLYAPYAGLAAFMALDMVSRLHGSLTKTKRD